MVRGERTYEQFVSVKLLIKGHVGESIKNAIVNCGHIESDELKTGVFEYSFPTMEIMPKMVQ